MEKGVVVHAIGGTTDHVHVAATISPTTTISRWIGELKGASAHYANTKLLNRQHRIQWQTGYGVVSFSTRDIAGIVEYITNQGPIHRARAAKEKQDIYQGPLARNQS